MKKFIALAVSVLTLGASVPAFAENASSSASSKATVNVACVQAAVDARETALMSGWSAFNTSISAGYQTRMTALHAAWAITERKTREEAVKKAWSAFHTTRKDARSAFNKASKTAWETFKKASKACKADVSVEASGMSEDKQ